jgi:hypothetical protein
MKAQNNIAYIFLVVAILNLVFFVDTIFTKANVDYYIFSIETCKSINLMYYAVISLLLFLIGAIILYQNHQKNKNK